MVELPDATLLPLLNRIADGDEQAVIMVYRHYHGFLHGFVRHRLSDEEAVAEIVQDTFLAVFRKPGAFDGRGRFSTWLCGIAKHKLADWARARQRTPQVDDVDDDALAALPDPAVDLYAQLENSRFNAVLRDCIDRLPEGQREALFWVFHEDATVETAAQHLACPPGTVKSRLFHARARLKQCLAAWLGDSHG